MIVVENEHRKPKKKSGKERHCMNCGVVINSYHHRVTMYGATFLDTTRLCCCGCIDEILSTKESIIFEKFARRLK